MSIASVFQFHIGSIKRFAQSERRRGLFNFNSTLVQLKDKEKALKEETKEDFNSTLVQLKVKTIELKDIELKEFQFHIGSIKS